MLINSQDMERSSTTKFRHALSLENLAAVCKTFQIDLEALEKKAESSDPPKRKPGYRPRRQRRKPYRARKPAKQAKRKETAEGNGNN